MAAGANYNLIGPVFSGGGPVTGPFLQADGTVALPAYSFSLDPDTGMYRVGADSLGFSAGGTVRFTLTATNATFTGNVVVGPGFALSGTNTSTGFLIDYSQIRTETKTASYTVAANVGDSGHIITNTGAVAQTIFTLPTNTAYTGANYTFINNTAFGLQLKASGSDIIRFPGSDSTAAGTQTTTTLGGCCTISRISSTVWACTNGPGGTWVSA